MAFRSFLIPKVPLLNTRRQVIIRTFAKTMSAPEPVQNSGAAATPAAAAAAPEGARKNRQGDRKGKEKSGENGEILSEEAEAGG